MSTKECVGFFLFYLDLELFAKINKDLGSKHSFSTLLLINQELNKIKKIPGTLWYILLQKILNSMVVGARQSFQFFRQKDWFLGNNRDLP